MLATCLFDTCLKCNLTLSGLLVIKWLLILNNMDITKLLKKHCDDPQDFWENILWTDCLANTGQWIQL